MESWGIRLRVMRVLVYVGICLFNGGILGIIVSRGSLIRVLMCLELLLLSVSLLIVNWGLVRDSIEGGVLFIMILIIAGAESSLGLGILVLYHRIRGVVGVRVLSVLRGRLKNIIINNYFVAVLVFG